MRFLYSKPNKYYSNLMPYIATLNVLIKTIIHKMEMMLNVLQIVTVLVLYYVLNKNVKASLLNLRISNKHSKLIKQIC